MIKNNTTPSLAAQYCAEDILLTNNISIGESLQILLNFVAEARQGANSVAFAEEILTLVCSQIELDQAVF